ncbi:Uncharacterised protein [Halioglobus japonicus]|nr:Uncharacterised protein [Halioglobus japonicus]
MSCGIGWFFHNDKQICCSGTTNDYPKSNGKNYCSDVLHSQINALRSGAKTSPWFLRPAPLGAHWRNLLLLRLYDPETEMDAVAQAKAKA